MPIPKPSAGESEADFMSRCMSDTTMRTEYTDREQRVAVCLSSFGGKMENEEYEVDCLIAQAEIKAYHDKEEDEEKGSFTGYGSIFGNKDLGGDVVMQGAFAKSIARKGAKGVKLLYQHRTDEPIGVIDSVIEDEKGLKIQGRLAMKTQKGKEVYELIKMGAMDGLSIGYRVMPKGYHYDDKTKRRVLKELDLMEISAVTFPMNPKARVMNVKQDMTVRDWENTLRDVGNLSRTDAKIAASAVKKALDQRDVGEEQKEIINSIDRLTNLITGSYKND